MNKKDPLKAYYASTPLTEGRDCPAPEKFFEWAEDILSADERERLTAHAAACGPCTEKIALIRSLKSRGYAGDALSEETLKRLGKRLRSERSVKQPSDIFRRLWFAAFACFMVLSFVFSKHFMQMLVLAVVCAAKWLLDTRAKHIYINVLHRREEGESPTGGRFGASGSPRVEKGSDR